jgi:LysM repeat protein
MYKRILYLCEYLNNIVKAILIHFLKSTSSLYLIIVTPTRAMATYTIQSGDTFSSIAQQFNTTVAIIEALNPSVNPDNLQIGQVINLPGQTNTGTQSYTIRSGDTFSSIAQKFNTTVAAIETLNPGVNPDDLQIGQVIQIPGPATSTYTIQSGDTFSSIAQKLNTNVAAIEALNPGVNPNDLQVGQVINVPGGGQHSAEGGYTPFSGPASNFPNKGSWASYDNLIEFNSKLMLNNDTSSEVASIVKWIPIIAQESGIDPRVILCIIMQESGGNVNVATTVSPGGVRNPGIMQSHNGVAFDPNNPDARIAQMIRDGTEGTSSGDGLVQCYQNWDQNYYEAARAYNSGSVNKLDLSDGLGATNDYVSKVANRLLGNVWDGM